MIGAPGPVPFVLQYNKRDIRNILPVEKLGSALNTISAPSFEAAALHGIGVFETLKAISKLAIGQIRRKLVDDTRRQPESAPVVVSAPATTPAPVPAAVTTAPPAPPPARRAASVADNPLLELVGDAPTGEVEFAEQETGKIGVRPVETRGYLDIQDQLEKLRTIAAAPSPKTPAPPAAGKGLEKRLADMLVPDSGAHQEVKRKASLEVPARLLKSASGLRLQLVLDGEVEEFDCEALSVRLVGNRRLERLLLRLDLEIRGKG
jgi:hypothetical protein